MYYKKKSVSKKRKSKKLFVAILIVLLFVMGLYHDNTIHKLRYPYLYKPIIQKYAEAYKVDPLLVCAVIRQESHFIPYSNSHKGAVGLMQIMPETAKEIAGWLKEDYEKVDLTKPEDNIRYGTWYLATLSKQFADNKVLVLAAYNAGGGRVNKWLENGSQKLDSLDPADIPFKETREYVIKVLHSYEKYTEIYSLL